MKRRLVLRPRAEADLREARDWYESRRNGLGGEFLAGFGTIIRALVEDPERQPDSYRGFRRMLVRRFPYKLFYRVEGDRIIVFRVLHARRNHSRLLPRDSRF